MALLISVNENLKVCIQKSVPFSTWLRFSSIANVFLFLKLNILKGSSYWQLQFSRIVRAFSNRPRAKNKPNLLKIKRTLFLQIQTQGLLMCTERFVGKYREFSSSGNLNLNGSMFFIVSISLERYRYIMILYLEIKETKIQFKKNHSDKTYCKCILMFCHSKFSLLLVKRVIHS